ncbi:6-carboxytetrahydropterin synthase [Acetobacteraceae bacterium KSS8]|uniref:6-carboxy-5,6,7,8-tetrahydropterin synthase n=1 Tax=Endosaccharibacter trunci TaxID=2812733 RepID=A0ABT1W3Z9_9PROT|nr:6-carboxytetrahydropterin synthase [Acetobacteraceae bacterium KSS8]
MLELRFTRRFSMGHRLIGGASESCALPHGHNEFVRVRLVANDRRPLDGHGNMVVSFERAKGRWHRFVDERLDHALQLSDADPLLGWFRAHEPERAARIVVTPGDPTTELMCCLLWSKLSAILHDDGDLLRCAELSIEETPTNAVSVTAEGADALLPCRDGWWMRADMSIS